MRANDDILAAFEIAETQEKTDIFHETQENSFFQNEEIIFTKSEPIETQEVISTLESPEQKDFISKCASGIIFLIKYLATSFCIFGVLLVGANYSAYSNLVYSFIYAEEMQATTNSLIESVAAWDLTKEDESVAVNTFKQLEKDTDIKVEEKTEYIPSMHSLGKLIAQTEKDAIDLWINITPYENRIVIPKIGKNIPLIDIKQQKVEWVGELNDIFMKELENGVIRYPGSAKPGETGNSFIFGHSSNFPWLDGDYNDIFALLDHVVYWDEVVVYYGQEKHTYKISTKNVIRPWDVSILKNDDEDRSKLTLMTCWPIGTTLNRLVLTGELISVE